MEIKGRGECAKEYFGASPCYLVVVCFCFIIGIIVKCSSSRFSIRKRKERKQKAILHQKLSHELQLLQHKQKQQLLLQRRSKSDGNWRRTLLKLLYVVGLVGAMCYFLYMNGNFVMQMEETLANMCDERARMLQDQFNVSMNHVHALAILVSTFHHERHPSAIDQRTFQEYTERTAFERPLTSGVAYALRVLHAERENFEQQQGWKIKKMQNEDQTLVQDCAPEKLEPSPVHDEYAPVIFAQDTVSHIVSIDMLSGQEDRENIFRARETGKGVLTSPFKLLKSNHLGVVLTFAAYNTGLPPHATPEQRAEASVGYIGASYDVPSLVEKLLQQLSSKQTIVVNVYDTTNQSASINMYGTEVVDTGLVHTCSLDFGDPLRKHEMHCRFKEKPSLPLTTIGVTIGILVITFLLGHIFRAAINEIAKVEKDFYEVMELKVRAEAADVAKSQFLATVSHEIRTPMNGVLGMLKLLMDTNLDAKQRDYAETAHESGKDLVSLINEVLDQAKIESGRLELEAVPFDVRSVLDNALSLFSSKSHERGVELAVYVSNLVPEVVIGDPGRLRQIITNLVGNSIKFTRYCGHILVTVHLANEVKARCSIRDEMLRQIAHSDKNGSYSSDSLSGFPVVSRWKSWDKFRNMSSIDSTEESEPIKLLVTVEDTGVGIPLNAQDRIFTPFMQADSSTSRTYGGTGIGLSISKRLVDLMGGEIGFVSEPGMGSTFSFTVALKKGDASSLDTKSQQYDRGYSELHGSRALVVDGRNIRAAVARYHLQRLGILVDVAPTLESACSFSYEAHKTSEAAYLAMVFIDKELWDREIILHHVLKEIRHASTAKFPWRPPKRFLLATSISPTERYELVSSGSIDNIIMKPLRLSVLIACFQETFGISRRQLTNRKNPPTLGNLLKQKHILVVDDNAVNRRVAEAALKRYGAFVVCVESGAAALSMLKPPHNFDACFMDIQMPRMDGFETTQQIRFMEREVNQKLESGEGSTEMYGNVANWHIPILAMTADVIRATDEECIRCGMDGFVSKPFEEEQLYSAVAQFFESANLVE